MVDQDSDYEKIGKRLDSIELRLKQLETALRVSGNDIPASAIDNDYALNKPASDEILDEEDRGLEAKIGRFGLAWLGNVVLILGIAFLTEYLMSNGHRLFSVILGYSAASAIFFLGIYLKKSNLHLSFMFKLNAQILLFFITVRLHFFSANPLLSDKTVAIVVLLLFVAYQTYMSVRDRSQALGALSIVFAIAASVLSDTTHFMLPMVIITAIMAIFYYLRFDWEPLLIIAVILAYVVFFLWLFGNPLMGHKMELLSVKNAGVVYLFIIGSCFSSLPLFRNSDTRSDDFIIGVTVVNGLLFTMLLALITLRFFSTNYVTLFGIITISCLLYSTVLKSTSDWNFASAFFALYGFMAMSISLYGLFGFPLVYLLLSVQSLIVVSMALWFRNRLIVIMNSLLFLFILMIYLTSSKHISGVNFSFALVSLISARVINWKRARLKIETDLIRNLYLIEGFIMMLYALYHAVPQQFITLSWTMVALLYFLLSLLMKNIKYRYLALGTMICAAFYLFIVDLARIEIIYRVLAFLFLAAISIGISMYYTNRTKKPDR
jgi:hypothetical protein